MYRTSQNYSWVKEKLKIKVDTIYNNVHVFHILWNAAKLVINGKFMA